LKFGVKVYALEQGEYKEISLLNLSRKLKPGEQRILFVYLGKKEKLPVRLVIEKVPSEVASEKRRKLKTDKQNKHKNLSQERLQFCDINAYITNTTEDQLPARDTRKYYSLRWQIEIAFKTWKTVYSIDKVKPMKMQRFECVHYGTLILILLTTRLMTYCKVWLYIRHQAELSELKLFKTIKLLLSELRHALKSPKTLMKFFLLLENIIKQTCVKERKRSKPTPFLIINPNP
jgi:hypothetical protein